MTSLPQYRRRSPASIVPTTSGQDALVQRDCNRTRMPRRGAQHNLILRHPHVARNSAATEARSSGSLLPRQSAIPVRSFHQTQFANIAGERYLRGFHARAPGARASSSCVKMFRRESA
jgi:hypothetical protein